MATPEQPAQSLQTPDPILSTESIGTFVVALIANLYILFGSDLSNEQQTALATVVTSLWLVFTLVHAAIVRKGRAQGGGLVSALINAGGVDAVTGSDPGDVPPPATPKPTQTR